MALGLTNKILMSEGGGDGEVEEATIAATAAAIVAAAAASSGDGKKKKAARSAAGTAKVLLKPQSKHLRTRIDYLIKVLQNQINTEQLGPDWKKRMNETVIAASSSKKQSRKKTDADDEETNKFSRKRFVSSEASLSIYSLLRSYRNIVTYIIFSQTLFFYLLNSYFNIFLLQNLSLKRFRA